MLLVEDDLLVRHLLRSYPDDHRWRLQVAANGPAAIRIINESEEPVDLLITDVVMPRVNGFELARAASARWPETKTLFISGTALPLCRRDSSRGSPWTRNSKV